MSEGGRVEGREEEVKGREGMREKMKYLVSAVSLYSVLPSESFSGVSLGGVLGQI